MTVQAVIALAIAIPLILFPAAFVWYLNLGGVFAALREARAARRATKVTVRKGTGQE